MFGNSYFGATYYAPVYFGPAVTVTTSGGGKRVKGKLTAEQARGLEAFGRARLGITDEVESQEVLEVIEEIVTPVVPEIPILSELHEIDALSLIKVKLERQESDDYKPAIQETLRGEEDIGLILALLTAHFN